MTRVVRYLHDLQTENDHFQMQRRHDYINRRITTLIESENGVNLYIQNAYYVQQVYIFHFDTREYQEPDKFIHSDQFVIFIYAKKIFKRLWFSIYI